MKQVFLLAMVLVLAACGTHEVKVIVTNPATAQSGKMRMVEVPVVDLGLTDEELACAVVTTVCGVELPSQVTHDGLLIWQTEMAPRAVVEFTVSVADEPAVYESKVYGRFVPERKDDWAWENDRIAFRMYGPALEQGGEVSNGLDVWLKRTEDLVINKWYKPGVNYHKDSGEGLDCYKVGRTLGGGVLSIVQGDSLVLGRNFVKGATLDAGPLRYTMQLDYAPQQVREGLEVKEIRYVSLDAGSQMNKMQVVFAAVQDVELEVAVGMVHRGEEVLKVASTAHSVAYHAPAHKKHGTTRLGVVTPMQMVAGELDGHVSAEFKTRTNSPIVYYAGAGWSKWGFETDESWERYVAAYEAEVVAPLVVEVL